MTDRSDQKTVKGNESHDEMMKSLKREQRGSEESTGDEGTNV